MPGAYWSDAEDDIIRTMWGTSTTAAIAAKLPGRTRNAIIGRADRIGCPRLDKAEIARRIQEAHAANPDAFRAHRVGGKYDPWRGQ